MTSDDGIGDDYGEIATGNRMSDTARVNAFVVIPFSVSAARALLLG
jgi:hypothetical protein